MPLAQLPQEDFALGSVRSVARHLIPENGAYEIINGLLDDDGSIYERGGSEYQSNAAFGSAGNRFLWDGHLTPGQRTFFANADDFGVLDSDDVTPVNLGGAGLASPARAAELMGIVFIGGGFMYGGSRKSADYSTGTVSTTLASKTVTGSGTTWNTLVDAGMLLQVGSERAYAVESIDSVTQLTLREPYEGTTAAGKAYALRPIMLTTAGPYRNSALYLVAGDRLLTLEGNRVYFSAQDKPHSFGADDYHELAGGARLLGGWNVRDVALIFATNGLWQLAGLFFDPEDDHGNPQHKLEHVSEDLILWSNEGIATYSGGLIAPCTDGVYLFDGVSRPEKLSRSITPVISSYVAAGHKTGLATTFGSHYFLPILDSSNLVVDLLVCRLDRPVNTRLGTVYPWTFMRGHGGNVTALATRVRTGARQPDLLASSRHAGSRILKLTGFFERTAARKNDADGTTVRFDLVTRDYPTGQLNVNLTRRVRLRYELEDAASDDPTIQAAYSVGAPFGGTSNWGEVNWDEFDWGSADAGEWGQLEGSAPEDDGRSPWTWKVGKKGRHIRFRFRSESPSARLKIRSLELFIRPSGKA